MPIDLKSYLVLVSQEIQKTSTFFSRMTKCKLESSFENYLQNDFSAKREH